MTQPLQPQPAHPRPHLAAVERPERRLPWHALDAESAVLAAVMLDNDLLPLVQDILLARYFFDAAHRYIWEAILSLAEQARPFDAVTLAEELRRTDRLVGVGGIPYLAKVVDSSPAIHNLEDHAQIVRKAWQLRELGSVAEKIAVYTRHKVGDPTETLARAEQAVLAITQIGSGKREGTHIGDAIRETFQDIERMGASRGKLTGLATGFRAVDAMVAGITDVDMMVLGGRPGFGKTSLAANIGVNVAGAGGGVQFFSYELLRKQLVTRLTCAEAQVDSRKLRKGRISDDDWKNLTTAAAWLKELPIWIDDDSSLTVFEIKARALRRKNECERFGKPLRLVIVDYLQMVKSTPIPGRSREGEVAETARELKRMAKALKVPVLALVSIGRESEKQNRRPRMSDIRESGNIESDTDIAAFLYADKDTPQGCASLHFDKNRNGKTGTVQLAWLPEFTRFVDYAGGPDGAEEEAD